MLGTQSAPCGLNRRQGSRGISLAELRSQLASPSSFEDGHRQRLLDLSQRLARVRALGNKYARLELSHFVTSAMDRDAAAV